MVEEHNSIGKQSMSKIPRIFIAVFLFFFVFSDARFALAEHGPIKKLKRGVVNVLTSPFEIPKELRAHWIKGSEKTYHLSAWLFCGLVKGLVMTSARVGCGAWDILTFPFNIPPNHEPLLKPATVFDDWPQRQKGVIYKNLGDK